MLTATKPSSTQKYIPPNKQQNSTVKKEPQKKTSKSREFSLPEQAEAFPSLSAAYKDSNSQHIKSFANATKTQIIKPQQIISDVKPGWVHIRKQGREIQCKYGPPSDRNPFPCEISDVRFGEMLVKYRLAKEQYDRDRDLERLGDLSEYYGAPTIQELFEEGERLMHKLNGNDDSENDSILSD